MRKNITLTILMMSIIGISFFSCKPTDRQLVQVKNTETLSKSNDDIIAKKVKEIMAKMSVVDKVGEMTQLSIDMVSLGKPYNLTEPHQLDEEKLKSVLVDYRVGNILNAGHAYTQDHWYKIISRIQEIATKEKPTGIPVLYGIDAIHGTNYTIDATLFPQQINLAATWNPSLAKVTGEITAYETRASAIPWDFSPVLDIGREPRWARFWETFGEDPVLATVMGNAMIKGYQGNDISNPEKVAACMKHFLGYSGPFTGKDRTQALIPERQLREYYLPTFKAAIDAGAATIMINSGEMNGIPVHCNPAILIDLLRDELGFEGIAVSDWEDIKYLHDRHRVSKDYKESIKMAITAGIDMSMVPVDMEYPVLLRELIEEGEIPMSRIDEAVERVLTLKMKLGLFEQPFYPKERYPKFGSQEHINASLQAAEESIVLLKNNNNVLPFSKNTKVLVTGPTANSILALNGGWGRTWQGNDMKWHSKDKKTILTALQDKLGKGNVNFIEGASIDKDINSSDVAEAGKNSDVIIVCLGEMPYTEKPGDIDNFELPMAQLNLVEVAAKSGKPVILIKVGGRPRVYGKVEPLASGILETGLAGDEGGRAIANILLGEVNPSGKLPYTYPRYANTMVTYDHRGTDLVKRDFSMNAFEPQFEFGHGLSYTTFEYSNLSFPKQMNFDGSIKISVDVKNTGDRKGKEVVQLYINDKVASITPSLKKLRGFEKIELQPGEMQTITFSIHSKELAFVGIENEWITEPGDFEIIIGSEKGTFVLGKSR